MVSRTTQNHVKETPKQPYQTIVSIGCLACALMQQITTKYAKENVYLGRTMGFSIIN
jgi:hypothetical protein